MPLFKKVARVLRTSSYPRSWPKRSPCGCSSKTSSVTASSTVGGVNRLTFISRRERGPGCGVFPWLTTVSASKRSTLKPSLLLLSAFMHWTSTLAVVWAWPFAKKSWSDPGARSGPNRPMGKDRPFTLRFPPKTVMYESRSNRAYRRQSRGCIPGRTGAEGKRRNLRNDEVQERPGGAEGSLSTRRDGDKRIRPGCHSSRLKHAQERWFSSTHHAEAVPSLGTGANGRHHIVAIVERYAPHQSP